VRKQGISGAYDESAVKGIVTQKIPKTAFYILAGRLTGRLTGNKFPLANHKE
jgi:hypothetical protein